MDQLGEGGMGVVYVGRHEALGRRVAVKVLRPEMSSKSDMVQRFFNEAQAASAIHHSGIAQVFDVGVTPDGQAYFVMELLEGETLAARLKQRQIDPGECCRIGRQIANVLQAAHAAGITHRDLKPDNLFLVPDADVVGGERVKVLDFGIAKLAGESNPGVQTRTGLVMGTPSYMSPEQCRGIRNADARSDIYSLGCILFKMVCGRAPFVGVGLGEIVAGHLYEAPPALRDLAPGLPEGLAALIAKMLEKQPDARPQTTMTAVSQAFDEVLAALGGSPARAATAPRRCLRRCRGSLRRSCPCARRRRSRSPPRCRPWARRRLPRISSAGSGNAGAGSSRSGSGVPGVSAASRGTAGRGARNEFPLWSRGPVEAGPHPLVAIAAPEAVESALGLTVSAQRGFLTVIITDDGVNAILISICLLVGAAFCGRVER